VAIGHWYILNLGAKNTVISHTSQLRSIGQAMGDESHSK